MKLTAKHINILLFYFGVYKKEKKEGRKTRKRI